MLFSLQGAGSGLMRRTNKLFDIVSCMRNVLDVPLTVKMRTGVETRRNTAHQLLPTLREYGVDLVTVSSTCQVLYPTQLLQLVCLL